MTGRAFVDTNVILYSFDERASHHARSKALVEQTRDPLANLWLSPQVFCEVFRFVTDPRGPNPREPTEVVDVLEALLARPGRHLLPVPPDLTARMVKLLRACPTLRGRRVFDVQIAATMLGNDLHRIYTFNTSDFSFEEIEALEPPELLHQPSTPPPAPPSRGGGRGRAPGGAGPGASS